MNKSARNLEDRPASAELRDSDQRQEQVGSEAEEQAEEAPAGELRSRQKEARQERSDAEGGSGEAPVKSLFGFPKRHPYVSTAVGVVLLLVVAGAVLWWLHARQYESTDDAFIDARTVTIAAEVSGRIVDVPVNDNQLVDAGTVLARIDDSDYRAALDQADAQMAEAEAAATDIAAQIEAQNAKIEQARKQVAQAQAALDFAAAENKRNQELLSRGTSTQQQAQQASSTLRQSQAELDSAQANVIAAQKQVLVLNAQAKSAQAKIAEAAANQRRARTALARTAIVAPTAGRATEISAAEGTYAQPGQILMMFVPRQVWVKANFKETQLDLMRPGQPVDIEIDTYPHKTFHGHVDSIQAGSGTAFSLLPAENATGNFVKVVQRVPVKIVFDTPPDVYLGPGMSVVPSVKVR